MAEGKDKIFALALCNANKICAAKDKELFIERPDRQETWRLFPNHKRDAHSVIQVQFVIP